MKNTSLRMKILSGMLCTGLALSTSSVSFAAGSQSENSSQKLVTSINFIADADKEKLEETRNDEMKDTLEIVIKDSVNLKIITKEEGEKVLEYVRVRSDKKCGEDMRSSKKKCKGEKEGLFNALVTDNILTKGKSDALKEKMYLKKTEIKSEKLKKGLNILVINKKLTKDQKNKVEKAIMEMDAQKKSNCKKIEGMNKKERKAYMKKFKKTEVNPIKLLIDNGTITKDQEKEIQKILPSHKHHHHEHHDNKKK